MADRKVDTGIIQRGQSYRFTVYLGYDVNGKQIRKTTTYNPPEGLTQRKSDKYAKEEYINFKNTCKGLADFNDNMRFKELVEIYFKVYAPNKLKPITTYNYENLIHYHFMDYFGNRRLKDITPGMITEFFNTHKSTDKDGNGKKLKSSTSRRLFTILQSLFSFAVSQYFIKETPCRNIILPKNQKEESSRKYLTEAEFARFLPLFDKYSDFNTIIKLLIYTGMRSGEALGLQWEDINFNDNTLQINHTLSDVGGKHFLTTPKTKHSKRVIYMSETVAKMLKEHRIKQLELQLSIPGFAHPEMVFTSALGNYKDRSALNTSFRRFLKNTEFDFLTLHSLRHCNATLLLNSGVDIKVVSEHLGHSDVGTTANIYTDVLASTRKKTAEILEIKLAK